jgi:hypothetical protein
LPVAYAVNGGAIFASGDSKRVPANTVMDVQRYEQDLAALSPDQRVTPLWVSGISPDFRDGYIGMWTAGLEQKIDGVTLDADYVGTAGIRLPGMNYANGYPGADPAFAPYTQFDSAGRVIGGYGLATIIAARSHSTYHALQVSARKDLTASGLGFQASYTFSKSLDDTSSVFGAQTTPQDPFNWRADRGPSSFDITHAFTFSLFQDLHLDRFKPLGPLGTTATRGWQLLGSGTALTGLPFTVNSGIQQTGVGSMGADRPDEIAAPEFSTSRTVREDYFGRGDRNATFFSIPLHVAGGTGPNEGRFGTLGRNVFRGPGFRNLDIAVIKDTPLLRRGAGEAMTLQFRAEFFNVFNIVNFGLPSNIVLGPGFGVIARTAGTSRQLQFSLKLMY